MGLNFRRILVINHRSLIAAGDVNGVIAEETGNVSFGIANFGSVKNSAFNIQRGIFKEALVSFEMTA